MVIPCCALEEERMRLRWSKIWEMEGRIRKGGGGGAGGLINEKRMKIGRKEKKGEDETVGF